MIDRSVVHEYNIKGKKDREHEIEEKEELNLYNELQAGGRTPVGNRTPLGMETPKVMMGGNSIHNPIKSSYHGGGGMSPGFQTPVYSYSERQFSEHRM